METAALEKAAPLLRTDQIEEMEGERETLQRKLQSPHIEDKGAVAEQLRRMDKQLETQRPRPYASHEIDAAVRREEELRTKWTAGMLSMEEMRKSPPGAVDRHRAWEKRNKPAIAEWQNIQRRMNAGSEDRESASIERFRPAASTMNMHNALIPGKQYHLPPEGAALPVIFGEAELALIREAAPEIAALLSTMTNEQRAQAKEMLTARGVFATKPKRVLSEEQKAAMKAGRERAKK